MSLLAALGPLLLALGLLLFVLKELLAALGPLLGPKSVVLDSFRGVWAGPCQLSRGLGRASGRKVAQTLAASRGPRVNFSGGYAPLLCELIFSMQSESPTARTIPSPKHKGNVCIETGQVKKCLKMLARAL